MKWSTAVLTALLFAVGCADNNPEDTTASLQNVAAWDTDDIWQLRPTPDPESPSGVYVPVDL